MSKTDNMSCACCTGGLGMVYRYDKDLDGWVCRSCSNSMDIAEMALAEHGIVKCQKPKRSNEIKD